MSYEEAYKKAYDCFLGWLVSFNKMKPDKDFTKDRLQGMKEIVYNTLNEMEDLIPEMKIIREGSGV